MKYVYTMEPCIICFGDMDMISYQDQREQTETCIRLDCGHAYHTRCILRCLSQMNQKCPNCNTPKTASQEITREGIVKNLISEIKKDTDMKFLLNEYKEAREELHESESQLRKDVKEFIEKRKEELCIDDKRKYFISCIARITSNTKAIARTKGPQYVGALITDREYHWGGSYFERLMFGKQQARLNYRLKFPYLRMSLY
jgi:hypothetical protein